MAQRSAACSDFCWGPIALTHEINSEQSLIYKVFKIVTTSNFDVMVVGHKSKKYPTLDINFLNNKFSI